MNSFELPSNTYPARTGDDSIRLLSGADGRWSPVRYDESVDVDATDLAAVLEAGRWAPSSFGEEPWRFIVARRDDAWRPSVERALASGNAWARSASVLMVGMTRKTFTLDGRPNLHAGHDLGLALGGMMSEAMARGLVTRAMGGIDRDVVRTAFAVPDEFDILWVMALGHHDPERTDAGLEEREGRPRRRRSLDQTVFGARFGAPLPL